MNLRSKLFRLVPLVGFSALEMSVSFFRMFLLTRLLGGYEFGFASALSASYALVEQMTDLAIYRFVLTTKSERYREALAVAHALSLLRGFVVAAIFVALSAPMACTLTQCADWLSFAVLAGASLIRGFEHLDVRVGERDYRYWPLLAASAISHLAGLLAMFATALAAHTHVAFLAYIVVQSAIYVIITHVAARLPYRLTLRSDLRRGALAFSLPLLLNGIGLAIYSQGDRLLVGAAVGVEALGLYAVTILIAIVPISALTKVASSIHFAGLHNAGAGTRRFAVRRQLYARAMPIIAASYAVVLSATLKEVMPFVFGPRFVISDLSVLLVSLVAFLRASRADPMTTLLLYAQSTKRLAASSQAPAIGLIVAAILLHVRPTIESVLIGILVGEVATLAALLIASRHVLGRAIVDYLATGALMLPLVLGAVFAPTILGTRGATSWNAASWSAAVAVPVLLAIAVAAWFALGKLYREGYGATNRAVAA